MLLTPEYIESWAERRMDDLDWRLMNGYIDQDEYDHEVSILNDETNVKYAEMKGGY